MYTVFPKSALRLLIQINSPCDVAHRYSNPGSASLPIAWLLDGFLRLDGVMPEHPPDGRLTLTRYSARFDLHPLSVCGRHVIWVR